MYYSEWIDDHLHMSGPIKYVTCYIHTFIDIQTGTTK